MKLFWKLFCSMVLIASVTASVGGYLLIDRQFRSSLDREVSALYEESDLLRFAIERESEVWTPFPTTEDLTREVQKMDLSAGGRSMAFRLADSSGTILAATATPGGFPNVRNMEAGLPERCRGWTMMEAPNGRKWLCAASPITLSDGTVYLENCRDVSGLFADRTEQYHSFFYLMLGLIAAVGLLSLLVSRWVLSPLGRLSAATKRVAAGELDVRVRVDSDDELGELSADFNVMALRLKRQVQELKDAARRQEDFMGSFAHEIKTPLTSIIGYADLLRSRPVTEAELQESAGYIFSEGQRLEAMSRKLMDMIVLDRRDFPLRRVPMRAFLERAAGAMRPAAEQAGVELKVRAEAAQVPLEPDLMETVILNLIDNARKASAPGGHILLEGAACADGYQVRVSDDGKGIPPGDLERVTEAFYMVDKSRARAQGGAGLGLALCSRIVELHGGTMDIESEPGKGTAVTIRLKGGEGA